MINNIIKTLTIILVVILAGIWLGLVRKAFDLQQATDYSIKSTITIGVLMMVSYIISLISPKK